MVMFIHRLDYQGMSENPEDKGKTQLIIAKHRNGQVGDIELMFRSSEVRFVDMQDSLMSQAEFGSAMNAPSVAPLDDDMLPPVGGAAYDDFSSSSEF